MVSSESVSRFLQKLFDIQQYQVTDKEHKAIEQGGLIEYIFRKIANARFRRSALSQETVDDTYQKIAVHVKNTTPIAFALPFGAYKNWQLWSYPEPEWSEAFNINYLLQYVAPIASAYPPGVVLHYSYGDSVMDTVSNMPAEDTTQYIHTLDKIISFFQDYAPQNVKLKLTRINDFYLKEEHREELVSNYEYNLAHWEEKYPLDIREEKLASARRNLMPKGVEDLTSLSEEEMERRYLEAAMWCDAHDNLKKRRGFNKYGSNIELVFVKGPSRAIHIGSCETSAFHFWVGTGVVEVKGGRMMHRIISQRKLQEISEQGVARFIPVESPLGKMSSNFDKVCVWENE